MYSDIWARLCKNIRLIFSNYDHRRKFEKNAIFFVKNLQSCPKLNYFQTKSKLYIINHCSMQRKKIRAWYSMKNRKVLNLDKHYTVVTQQFNQVTRFCIQYILKNETDVYLTYIYTFRYFRVMYTLYTSYYGRIATLLCLSLSLSHSLLCSHPFKSGFHHHHYYIPNVVRAIWLINSGRRE